MKLENTYAELPANFYERIKPEHFGNPKLIALNKKLSEELDLDFSGVSEDELAQIFSGQKFIKGSDSMALAYAGFQYGHPVPQLGDGRAHLLGQASKKDIQLKGSGRTKFSRRGDGRSALGPVLREYIVSEAMNVLGVPTTRALAAVSTGEEVFRQNGPEPGGVFTRVAESHIRVGTFQYFAFQNDLNSIEILLNYTIERHYPELKSLSLKDKCIELLKELSRKQSRLVSKWTAFGFIHGVMNTDNFSLAGITIDYGPCAFMDEFKFDKVFSSIDRHGRYSYFNQLPIAQWNILRLADCLISLIDSNEKKAIEQIEKELKPVFDSFSKERSDKLVEKLGIRSPTEGDESLVMKFLRILEKEEMDFTLSFRNLIKLYHGEREFYPNTDEFKKWTEEWRDRVDHIDSLNKINPIYIPRNHQIEWAIEEAYKGNFFKFHQLNQVLANPFEEIKDFEEYSIPPLVEERVEKTFCGT